MKVVEESQFYSTTRLLINKYELTTYGKQIVLKWVYIWLSVYYRADLWTFISFDRHKDVNNSLVYIYIYIYQFIQNVPGLVGPIWQVVAWHILAFLIDNHQVFKTVHEQSSAQSTADKAEVTETFLHRFVTKCVDFNIMET